MVAVYARALRPPARPQTEDPAAVLTDVVRAAEASTARRVQLSGAPSTGRQTQRAYAAGLAWTRDPFTRGRIMSGSEALLLSGILWDASAPLAMINGQMLGVGETVDGYQVVDISPDSVSLTDGTETLRLLVSP
jgi:hypothetical protein